MKKKKPPTNDNALAPPQPSEEDVARRIEEGIRMGQGPIPIARAVMALLRGSGNS